MLVGEEGDSEFCLGTLQSVETGAIRRDRGEKECGSC